MISTRKNKYISYENNEYIEINMCIENEILSENKKEKNKNRINVSRLKTNTCVNVNVHKQAVNKVSRLNRLCNTHFV